MGFFAQSVEKFAGFAGKKALTEAVSAVPAEAAAFIKGLEGTQELRMVHSQEKGFQQISLMSGEKKVGNIKFKEFGKGVTVTGIYSEVKGYGTKLRQEAGRVAKAAGKEFVISDVYGSMSADEMESWNRLKKLGHSVSEVNVPYAELGLKREGGKFAFKWNLGDEATHTVDKSAMMAHDAHTVKQVMQAGAGNDSTSLLNRGIKATGSRRMTGAL